MFAEQITAGVRVIKAMGSSEREEARFAGTNRALFDDSMRVARARAQSETVTHGALFLLTGGGPSGATDILITKVYDQAFINFRFGISAAWSVVIFFIILIISGGFNKITKGMEDGK